VKVTTNRLTGKVIARTNVIIEIGAGLNVTNGSGKFVPADPSFEISPTGADARGASHRLEVPADIGSGEGVVITKDEARLVFQPLALSYFDPSDRRSLLLDTITNAVGFLISSNIVVYSNCFPSLHASIRIKNTRHGVEADVVFSARPPDPEAVGLSRHARLECVTEQLSGPSPSVSERVLRRLEPTFAEPEMRDSTLSFNGMKMVTGRAFMLGTNGAVSVETIPVTVGKTYYTNAARRFVIEGVEHGRVAPALQRLPVDATTMTNASLDNASRFRSASITRDLPERRVASAMPARIHDARALMASVSQASPAFLLDWTLVNTSGITNYVFSRGVTYLINGATPAVGVTRFQSAVLKYIDGATLSFGTNDTAVFDTDDFSILTCTTIDNDAVGESIPGSTGSPTRFESTWAFQFDSGNRELHDLRMSHMYIGVWSYGGTITARNVQAVDMTEVFQVDSTSTLNVHNALAVTFDWLYVGDSIQFVGEHLTAHAGMVLGFAWQTNSSTATVKNSLLVALQYPPSYAGAYSAVESPQLSSASGVFQTAICGQYYLNGSTYRDIGTTNLDVALLKSIRGRTTYPPQMYTTPVPRAARDTNGLDLGFHYSPVDVIASNVVGSASFGPDTVIGVSGYSYYWSFQLPYGESLISAGTPDLPNRFLFASSVQESPDLAVDPGLYLQYMIKLEEYETSANLNFQATEFLMGGALVDQYAGSPSMTFQNCRFYDCSLVAGGYTADSSVFTFQNNLFDNSSIHVIAGSYPCTACVWDDNLMQWVDGYAPAPVSATLRNNLFLSSGVTLETNVSATVTDNLFDGIAPSVDLSALSPSHNGFTVGTSNSIAGANDVESIVPDYVRGPLGKFYYPTNGTNLARLINAGSQSAPAAGLYHFTTTTNYMETNSTVDIGWHVPAVGPDGNPLDTDGDGMANAVEDADGDGVSDAWETPWLLGIIVQPQSRLVNAGSNVLFSVTAGGTAPIYYQWRYNGVAIAGANSSTFTVWNAYPSVAGSYSIVLTNVGGSVTSQVASLTVNSAPWIISHPTNRVVGLGNNPTFSVVAGGTAPLFYQWRLNGTNVAGKTNSSLTVTAVATNLGNYSVLVSNMAGTVISSEANLSVVLVNKVIVDGSNPEIANAHTVCSGQSVALRAIPIPADATFPTTPSALVWTILSQPTGSTLSDPPTVQTVVTVTPIVAGTYVIRARLLNSSNIFTLTCIDPADVDYNALGGCQELDNGSNFLRMRLGTWPFDASSFSGLQGQMPLSVSNVGLVNGWSVLAAGVSSSNGPAQLRYRETEPGSAIANINCREGSLRFWFRPDWSSTGTNYGSGPGVESRLIDIGSKNTTNGWWGLALNAAGTNLYFGTQTNDTATLKTNVLASVRWPAGAWQQIVLTYASTGTVIYLNGQAAAFGTGLSNWPGASVRTQGFRVGTDADGTNWAKGAFDNLETFNYALSASEVAVYYAGHPRPVPTNACLLAPIALYYAIGTTLTNGEIAYSTNGLLNGEFGWLKWKNDPGEGSANNLAAALTNHTLSTNFVNAHDANDRTLSVGDWIFADSGNANSVNDSLNWLITNAIPISVVLWNNAISGGGANGDPRYEAAAYARITLLEANTTGNPKWLKYRYEGSTECDSISNQPPLIVLTEPADNQVFNTPANIRLAALAWDAEDLISTVQFFSGTNLLATRSYSFGITESGTNTFAFTWSGVTNGTYSLSAVVTDQLGLRSTSLVVSVRVNRAPIVNAGPDQTNVWPNNPIILVGTVTDDGQPSSTITSRWTRASGPGSVTFSNALATNTHATLPANGTFKLRLTAGDTLASAYDDMLVTVWHRPAISIVNPLDGATLEVASTIGIDALASDVDGTVSEVRFYQGTNLLRIVTNAPYSCLFTNPALTNYTLTAVATDNHGLSSTSAPVVITIMETNGEPSVDAGPDQTIIWTNNQVTLAGRVTDDGRPLGASVSWFWSKDSGPGTVTFSDSNSLTSLATFSTNGNYTLRLTANDTAKTNSDTNEVHIQRPSDVQITNPIAQTIYNLPTNILFGVTNRDPATTVVRVEYFVGEEDSIGVTTNAPFTLVWSNPPYGIYEATAVATVDEGISQTSTGVVFTVNQPPSINPGPPQQIVWPLDAVTLNGSVWDDGLPTNGILTTVWSKESGPGIAQFENANNTNTLVTFSTYGTNILRLTASDGAATNSTNVTITILRRPSVVITNPSSGTVSNVPANISIAAEASDLDGSVTQVQFFAGTTLLGTVVPPVYSLTWTNPLNAIYSLTAVATDNSGLTATSTPVVLIVNQPPSADAGTNQLIHWPANQVTLYGEASDDGLPSGLLTVSWSAVSGQGTVVFGNSNSLSTTATFSTGGVYTLKLSASDGAAVATNEVSITVNLAPTPSITAPTNGQIFANSPTNLTITAAATDPDGSIALLQVYQGTNLLGQGTSNTLALTFTNVTAGTYSLTARATDNHGAVSDSLPLTFFVARPSSYTYTLDADFDSGTLVNLNHSSPTNDQLQLNQRITPFPFVNVACSGRGTVARIDVNTGEIVGEYLTAPDQMGRDPSRTTVDRFGNVWVANRGEPSSDYVLQKGSVARIGLVVGGTRGRKNADGSFTPDPGGEYLKPPFYYNTCVDRDGDGLIRTSRGRGHVLPWSNMIIVGFTNVDTLGDRTNSAGIFLRGVSTAEDEAIINYVRTEGTMARTLAVDANNDLWVGGYYNGWHEKYSGLNGLPFDGTKFRLQSSSQNSVGGYGGLIDQNGVLWSANGYMNHHLLRYNPATQQATELTSVGNTYGLGIDPNTGYIWVTSGDSEVRKLSSDGTILTNRNLGGLSGLRGVAVDDSGDVWIADYVNSSVAHLRASDAALVGRVDLQCGAAPTGVAIDSNGKVWVTARDTDDLRRIDPNAGPMTNGFRLGAVDLSVNLGTGAAPYNYSDMTGFVSLGATARAGTWTIVQDNQFSGTRWNAISWTASIPSNTSLRVEVRAADSVGALPGSNFITVSNGVSIYGSNIIGRFVEIRATFGSDFGVTNSPTLYDLTISSTNSVGFASAEPLLNNGNHAPVGNLDDVSVLRNSVTNRLNVLANDTDADGDALYITGVSTPQHGQVAISDDGQRIIYTPDPLFFGSDQFAYTFVDGRGGLARAPAKVQVTRVIPSGVTTASNDVFVVNENSVGNLLDVLDNDLSAVDAPLRIVGATQPESGYVTTNACGTRLLYTLSASNNFIGAVTFNYTMQDTNGGSSTATVTVYVRNVDDDPPTTRQDYYTNAPNSTNVLFVLENDFDPEGQAFSIFDWSVAYSYQVGYADSVATLGTVAINADRRSFTYVPRPNWEGTDAFQYRAVDTNGNVSLPKNVSVTLTNGTNDPPHANFDYYFINQNAGTQVFAVRANDFDNDSASFSLTAVTQPGGGTASITDAGYPTGSAVAYTPTGGFFGSNSFQYTLQDSGGATATGTVVVFVSKTGASLFATNDSTNVLVNSVNNEVSPLANDVPTNGTLSLFYFTLPLHGELTRTNDTFFYTPALDYAGVDSFNYWITDGQDGYKQGSVSFTVRTNGAPVAKDDNFAVQQGSSNNLSVTNNDSDPNADAFSIVSVTEGTNGASVGIFQNGYSGYVTYQPAPSFFGQDFFTYTVRDVFGAEATATVVAFVAKTGNTAPRATNDSVTIGLNTADNQVPVLTNDFDADGDTLVIIGFGQSTYGTVWADSTNMFFTPRANWTGTLSFSYSITDQRGATNSASVFANVIADTSQPPLASITSVSNQIGYVDTENVSPHPLLREGLVDIVGTAGDPDAADAVAYAVIVSTPSGQEIVRNNRVGRITNGILSTIDFTLLQNGVYDIRLEVFSGAGMTNTQMRVVLDSNLKIGQFSFSEQDLVVPAGGFPLSVIRTYNSLNPNKGDFGFSWSYNLVDLQVEMDEERDDFIDFIDDDIFNMRVGGGRNVTLTLPDGRRTTFLFSLVPGASQDGVPCFCYVAKWTPPSDVVATLVPTVSDRLIVLPGLSPYWEAAGYSTPLDNFDFKGFTLTLNDGTQFDITREDLGAHDLVTDEGKYSFVHSYGKASLKRVRLRSGDRIEISSQGLDHTNAANQLVKSVRFIRDSQGRIQSIYDSLGLVNGVTSGPPAVKYFYSASGNLTYVLRLVDRSAGTYTTNSYFYEDGKFPHYLTRIADARGVSPLRTLYDGSGRMIGTVDAFGKTNRFVHDLTNRTETIYDRDGRPTTHTFDSRGNITMTIDALNQVTRRGYDTNNNVTFEADALGNTNRYAYDARGNRTAVTNALGQFTLFTYDTNNQLRTVTDALGNTTENRYDSSGNLTNSIQRDSHSNVVDQTFSSYVNGQLVQTRNGSNQLTSSFLYDAAGNLTNAADANQFNRAFRYDGNGNQTNTSYVWMGPSGTPVTVNTFTEYDAAGRVTRTIDADGNTNRTFYNAMSKVDYSIDKFGNTNSFLYDARGNVIQSTYADGNFTRTVYDENARPYFTTDRSQTNGVRTYYDAIGRVTNSVRLTGVRIDIENDPNNSGQQRSVIGLGGTALSSNLTEYFANGWVKSRTSPDGKKTSYEYWPDGRMKTVTDPLTNVTQYSYDEAGRQRVVTDALNRETQFEYDTLGRIVRTIYPDASYSSNWFNGLGQRVGQIDQAGLLTRFDYTLAGQLHSVTKPPVANPTNVFQTVTPTWIYDYDTNSRLSVMTDPKGRTNNFAYDAVGRQFTRRLPMGQTDTNLYNAKGQLWKKYDFKGQRTEFVYDRFSRVQAKFFFEAGATYPSNAVCYQYNTLGQLWKIVERSGPDATTNACDGYAVLVGFDDKDQRWATVTRVASQTAASLLMLGLIVFALRRVPRSLWQGVIEFYLKGGWCLANVPEPKVRKLRLPSLWWRFVTLVALVALISSDPHVSHLFLARAQCVYPANASTETTRITEFSYDFEGRLAQVNSPEGVINYGYDLATGRHTSTCTTNSEVAYAYDELGRLKTVSALKRNGVTLTNAEVTTYTYTKVGSRDTMTLPNGIVTTYRYDSLNRLTNLTHKIGTTNIASYSYQLHPTGRRTSAVEVLQQEDGSYLTNTLAWQYDGMYRLTNEVSSSSAYAGQYSTLYQYDEVGNRLKKIRQTAGVETIDYSYNNNDQLLQEVSTLNGTLNYGYDANGSLIGKTNGSATVAYAYNLANKLSAVTVDTTTTRFLYNDSGIRVRSMVGTNATHFLIDANNHTGYAQILEEITTLGTSPSRSYVIGDDVLAQCGTTPTTPSYFLYDGHGSTRQVASTNATVTSRYNYDAYGVKLDSSSTPAETSLLYSGEQLDSTLGMYNLRARYYNPASGTFNQKDTFEGDNFDPQSLHKYAYCSNLDPVNGSDPSGNMTVIEMMSVATITLTVASLLIPAVGAAYLSARGKVSFIKVLQHLFELETWGTAIGAMLGGVAIGATLNYAIIKMVGITAAKRLMAGVGLFFAVVGLIQSIRLTWNMITGDLPPNDADRYVATMLAGIMLTVGVAKAAKSGTLRDWFNRGSENDAAFWQLNAKDQAAYNRGQGLLPADAFNRLAQGNSVEAIVSRGTALGQESAPARVWLGARGFWESIRNQFTGNGYTFWGWLKSGPTPDFRAIVGNETALAGAVATLDVVAED